MKKNIIRIILLTLLIPFTVNGNIKIDEVINIEGTEYNGENYFDIKIPEFELKKEILKSTKNEITSTGNYNDSIIDGEKIKEKLQKLKYKGYDNTLNINTNEFIPNLNYNENGEIGKEIEIEKVPEIFKYLESKIGKEKLQKLIKEELIEIVGIGFKKNNFYEESGKFFFNSDKNEKVKIKSIARIEQKLAVENLGEEKNIIIKISPFDKNIFTDGRYGRYSNKPNLIIYDNSVFYQNLKLIVNGVPYKGEQKYYLQKFYNDNESLYKEQNPYKAFSFIPYYEYKVHFKKNEKANLNISYDLPDNNQYLEDFTNPDINSAIFSYHISYGIFHFRFLGVYGEKRNWLIHLDNFGRSIIDL